MNKSKVKDNFLTFCLKKICHLLFSRFTLAFLFLVLQLTVIVFCAIFFNRYLIWLFGGSLVIGLLLTIFIINQNTNPAFQISWIILILLVPTVGIFIYLFVKLEIGVMALSKRYQKIQKILSKSLKQDSKVIKKLEIESKQVANYAHYMMNISGYPIYQNTKIKYYSFGNEMYEDLLKDLKEAKDYIFLEYFIVAKGMMWDSILDILKEKAKNGVHVSFMYDGTCSFILLPNDYQKELEQFGIHTKIFNPVVPIISTHYNNRDHRKIVVIDGKISYTGGINLADEYIGKKIRFGTWKDNGIRIVGDAVDSFVLLFLENWNATGQDFLNVQDFLRDHIFMKNDGFVLPFGDNPFDEYQVGEENYLSLIEMAEDSIHIIMPYFIVDHKMESLLCKKAKSGVEVILIMPGIPDKKLIYYIGRTYYKNLLQAGGKIYQYSSGFTHAKMVLSDTKAGIIGTINLDYRSLYLHFENAVYLYQNSTILKMEEDYQKTLLECQEITMEDVKKIPWWQKLIGRVLKVFAPLL